MVIKKDEKHSINYETLHLISIEKMNDDLAQAEKNPKEGIWIKLKNHTSLWFATILTGILTTFSQYIADSIKSGLDKSEQRTQYFNAIATDLSKYNFDAETVYNAYFEAEANKGIGVDYIKCLADDYNKGIENLRSKEYLYRAQIGRGWGKKFIFFNTPKTMDFDVLYLNIKQLDSSIHLMNPIALSIIKESTKTYQLTHSDSILLSKNLSIIKRNLDLTNNATKRLLKDL